MSVPLGKRLRRNKTFRRARRASGAWFMRTIGGWLYRWSSRSWKVQIIGQENLDSAPGEGGGYFMSLWHGRMLIGLPYYGGTGYQVLVSQSADGDISERLLKSFQYRVIRGSSSKGGARALRAMLAALRNGDVLVITPDGPRGPRHSMNPGLAWMAKATGYGVVPCGFAADKAWSANSWDQLTVPKPGARVVFAYGEPVYVGRKADEAEQARATDLIQERMLQAEAQAAEALGIQFVP
ncbi:MAG: lysophospholipid acyltransferase (LPLAT)-like uncharacterized protein [Candidatus Paceibacteria bacterium]|jgi:lysophospholipid acyltransferase (LPLAT)-like uncharacterized protein